MADAGNTADTGAQSAGTVTSAEDGNTLVDAKEAPDTSKAATGTADDITATGTADDIAATGTADDTSKVATETEEGPHTNKTLTETTESLDTPQTAEALDSQTKEGSESTDEQEEGEEVKIPLAKSCKTEEEVVQFIKDRIDAISPNEEAGFANKVVLRHLKGIGRIYWDRRKFRVPAAKALVDNQFGVLAMKMLEHFNLNGVFHADETWFPCYYTLTNLWNFTDYSRDICMQATEAGIVVLLLSNLTHQPYLDNIKSKNVLYVIKSSLSILSNIARVPEAKPVFTENNAVEAVKQFVNSTNLYLKIVSMMLLTNIISEQENATLEDTGAIAYTVTCLRCALKSEKRRHRGFAPSELVEGLGRMVVNDDNKMKVIDKDTLPLLVTMMKENKTDEQFAAVQCLWTLSFGEEARERIKSEPECMDELDRLRQSEHENIARAAKGALWVLKEQSEHTEHDADKEKSSEDAEEPKNHIFISYNWDHQPLILNLRDRLKADGYRVWVDVDQMGGSTLEAMAGAVENAAVVLVGISEKYKLSPNCRTEAEYTFQLHKQIVPLMMQRRYRADGWLGMLMGAKLYINFDGKHSFDDAYQMLLKEIAGRGKMENTGVTAVEVQQTTSAPGARDKSNEVRGWSSNQIVHWLEENNLGRVKESFSEFDGKLLVRFNKIRHEAPDYFYKALDRKLQGDTLSLCKFAEALDELLQ